MNKFLLALFLLLSGNVYAYSQQDCVALVENKYQNTNSLSAKFVQNTYISLTNQNIERSGLFYFQKKGKFRIEYLPPNEKIYSSDGKTLFAYSGDKSDMVKEPLNNETIPSAAYAFLRGFENLSNHFEIKNSEQFKVKQNTCALFLIPKIKTSFDSLDVLFDKNGLLSEIVINNKSGNKSHYKFSNVETKDSLSNELFKP